MQVTRQQVLRVVIATLGFTATILICSLAIGLSL